MSYTNGLDKPSDYFNTILWTGNGVDDRSISGVGFQPDWVWYKERSSTSAHKLYDAVRTATKELESNSNAAESTNADALQAFETDGFQVGTHGSVNENGQTYVAWNWKAGTSVSGDTTGSGTLKTYTGSVNTTSGFSIIKYTGNGTAGHTIPHHLGVAPSAIFVKKLNELGDWSSYHSVLGNAGYMRLNNTNAFATASTYWNNTSPTSSVFTTGTTGNINGSDSTYIAYCFTPIQGYSKFGSYNGNSNADGTFVYTGFKPAFVMVKMINGADDWQILDNKRSPHNIVGGYLLPNSSSATINNDVIDFTATGFKLRKTFGSWNHSSYQYLYMAFAEESFVSSSGVPATAR